MLPYRVPEKNAGCGLSTDHCYNEKAIKELSFSVFIDLLSGFKSTMRNYLRSNYMFSTIAQWDEIK